MLNFECRSPGKRCSQSDRLLLPDEEFFSALIEKNGELIRLDFAAECWQGPPPESVGWWKTRMPGQHQGRVYWAPREVLLAYFDHVRQQPQLADVAYLMGLLLAQKRILSTKELHDQLEPAILYLENKKDKVSFEIPIVPIPPARILEIQNEFAQKLFSTHQIDPEESQDL